MANSLFSAFRLAISGIFGINTAKAHEENSKKVSPLTFATAVAALIFLFIGSILAVVFTVLP